ncbi:MAG TPA: NAD-dependent epimerase/dehydratase family protein, partial [Polyangiaceae bacterium]|nr:NAD-dependent epimerase/dehydratase family protein [Polyangiaceae bacterium]
MAETKPQQPAGATLITGASGYVGRLVVRALAQRDETAVIATDVRPVPEQDRVAGVTYAQLDITDAERLRELLEQHRARTVVHLAAIVTPRPGDTREMQYAVDVDGTQNVLAACVATGVEKLVYTSSGAAYG